MTRFRTRIARTVVAGSLLAGLGLAAAPAMALAGNQLPGDNDSIPSEPDSPDESNCQVTPPCDEGYPDGGDDEGYPDEGYPDGGDDEGYPDEGYPDGGDDEGNPDETDQPEDVPEDVPEAGVDTPVPAQPNFTG